MRLPPEQTLSNTLRILGGQSSSKTVSKGQYWQMSLTFEISEQGNWTVLGDGYTKIEATQAAHLHALAELHNADLLRLAFNTIKLSDKEYQEEKGGLVDIYNYAARYCCVPQISIRRTKSPKACLISIVMPEHEIEVRLRVLGGQDRAELAAARGFKKQAELYHLKKGTESIVVKDSTALTAANALDFFQFCRDQGEPVGWAELKTQSEGSSAMGSWTAVPVVRDVAMSPDLEVRASSKATAIALGYLVAAVSVVKEKPWTLDQFTKALRQGNGRYLGKLKPVDAVVRHESLLVMQQLNGFASRHRRLARESNVLHHREVHHVHPMRPRQKLSEAHLAKKSVELQTRFEKYHARADLEQLRRARADLPMSQYAPQVREIVQNNIYCVIIGATGSGKTTQVPQILLDQAIENGDGALCNVVCTQPRRIAATSVARRVANERAENLQQTVGYQVRFDAQIPEPGGSILYCTTGILLQQLQHSPDEVYDHVSHLVIDEVHERDMIIDFLLIILKKTMAARAAEGKKVPRVILMSATIDAERFAMYFQNSLPSHMSTDCPTLSVPGRTFPVKEQYVEGLLEEMNRVHGKHNLRLLNSDRQTREYLAAEQAGLEKGLADVDNTQESIIDWKARATSGGDDALADSKDDFLVPLGLAATTIAHIAKTTDSGAILVFLPGLDEIVKLDKMLRVETPLNVDFRNSERFQIFMLHSSIPDSQKTVFEPIPKGCRKIILSTNIAETSVTIPDVQFVVDTGKSREKRYDQTRRITQLQCTWISKSNAKQRAGRAGRVQNGNYYALFTRSRRESMNAIGLPELLRSDLQEICLDVKSQAFDMPVRDFLAEAMEPPSPVAVDMALQNLTSLGALTKREELTPLGRLLSSLPVHPTLGKMIVLGIIFRCLDPMIVLGAAAHERPLLVNPPDKKREQHAARQRLAKGSQSDHMVLLNAFRVAREVSTRKGFEAEEVMNRFFIHRGAFKSIDATARQIEEILIDAKLVERGNASSGTRQYGGRMLNQNSGSEEVIKALLAAGLYPNIAVLHGPRSKMFRTSAEKATFIHPSSINAGPIDQRNMFLTYTNLSLSSDGHRMTMRDTTLITPLMTMLFGGRWSHDGTTVTMDHWLPFLVHSTSRIAGDLRHSPATTLVNFRRNVDAMLAAAFDDLSEKEPLTDDPLRGRLAHNLAGILALEATNEPSVRGWASGQDARGQYGRGRYGDRRASQRSGRPVATGDFGESRGDRYWDRTSASLDRGHGHASAAAF